jgi:hypothetical protein
LFQQTNSPLIGYYYYTLGIELKQNQKDFLEAEAYFDKIKDIILLNSSVYTPNRYGTFLINKANNELFLNRFDLAKDYAISSKEYFKGLSLTNLIVDEILFFAYFYLNEDAKCEDLLTKMLDASFIHNKKLFNKFLYFKACLDFKNSNFEKCLLRLNEISRTEFDKGEYVIFSSFLKVMCLIELNELDSVDLEFQALQKYIKRNYKSRIYSIRVKLIMSLFSFIISNNFELSKLYKNLRFQNHLKSIESDSDGSGWETKSAELIRINYWIRSKVEY